MNGNLFDAPDPPAQAGWLTAHCDGGSRGNPGPSGYGAVVEDPQGRVVARLGEFLGIQTNNFAEYSGLLAVLKWAIENNTKSLRVVSDSELMVKQMQGKYKVASPVLRPLYEEARRLSRQLERFEMRHTLRGGNQEADRLANEAMDRGMGKRPSQQVSGPASQPASGSGGVSGARSFSQSGSPAARPYGKLETTPIPPTAPAAKPTRQVLEGYVKGGVVHLLEGELPDGVFVKVIRE
jgi:probable phosphoglycerate mutase